MGSFADGRQIGRTRKRRLVLLDLTLVPFGYRHLDDEFVDVAEVPRGKASGCICWSCRMPLVAKQGDVKQWHFAHATRGTYRDAQDKCEFSFFVSVRMMARQVVGKSIVLDLPAYHDTIERRITPFSRSTSTRFTITEASSVELSAVEVEKTFNGVPVDLIGSIADFTFVVYFTHPGRDLPEALEAKNLAGRRCGVVAVELDHLAELFAKERCEVSHTATLGQFLSHHTQSKRWIFHPRCDRARTLALERLPQASKPETARTPTLNSTARRGQFHCVVCGLSWGAIHDGRTVCPKCSSHMYVSFKGYFE